MRNGMLLSVVMGLAAIGYGAEDAQLERAKLELVVEQAKELCEEAMSKGSATHTPQHQYYFGLVYGCGTNLLARPQTTVNTALVKKYMKLAEKNYEAYTKIEDAEALAQATGSSRGKKGSRTRVKRIANVDRLREQELSTAIRQWESFVGELKKKQ